MAVMHGDERSMNTSRCGPEKIALLYMPWGAIKRPSIALGILKQCLKQAGFDANVHYFNLPFAGRIGLELYESISTSSAIHPEWFFSNKLFGPDGLNFMGNSWQDMQLLEHGQQMTEKIVELAKGSLETCFSILNAVPEFIESCLEQVDWSQYKVAGFSVTFAQTLSSLLLAKRLKDKHPHLTIVFGGANVDSVMGFELLQAFDWVDYVVHGEAERSFPQLLSMIYSAQAFDRIAGVSARRGTELIEGFSDAQPLANMNESPEPDYSDYFREIKHWDLEKSIRVSLPIESSRGCWWGAKHHCTFCGLNGTTMGFRKKSAARVYEEIMSLSERYRCLAFSAVDNIMDMGYFRDLLPQLAEADVDLSFFYEVKANLTRAQIRALAEAGINSIQPGIESFSTELLRLMRKGVTAIQNIQFLKWCYEFDIDPQWNVLYAFPGETRAHYADYPRLFRLLFHLKPPAGVFPVIFERFSPYHFEPEKFNLSTTPIAEYRLLYPERVIDLNKMAYYFEGKWEGAEEPADAYMQPVHEAHGEWLERWQEKKISFYYEKGPGFLTIYDNRPRRPGAEPVMRLLNLNALQAKIYLFCDENRSFKAIREMLAAQSSPPTEEQTRKLLEQFVEQGLMFREADRYLSLAVRKNAARKPIKQAAKLEQPPKTILPVLAQPLSVLD